MSVKPLRSMEFPGGQSFAIVNNDIFYEPVDAIVNPANGGLAHGGGLAAVISEKAGAALDDECDRIVSEQGHLDVGSAVATTAGRLEYNAVVHVVGPRMGQGDEEDYLVRALKSAFRVAVEQGLESISFPGVSSGIFSVPYPVCARGYLRSVLEFYRENPESPLNTVRCCLSMGPLLDETVMQFDCMGSKDKHSPVDDCGDLDYEDDVTVYELDEDEIGGLDDLDTKF